LTIDLTKRLQALTALNHVRIAALRDYLDTMNGQLQAMAVACDTQLADAARRIADDDERAVFQDYANDRSWDCRVTFPRVLRNSFHVAAVALLESELLSLAAQRGVSQAKPFGCNSDKPVFFNDAQKHIESVTGVTFKECASWKTVDDGRLIRNAIVHYNGMPSRKMHIESAGKYDLLDEEALDGWLPLRPVLRVTVTHAYCMLYLAAIEDFFADLLQKTRAYL